MLSRILRWIGCILLVVTLSGQSCSPAPAGQDPTSTSPTLAVVGPNPATVERNDVYRDYGAVASGGGAGDLTSSIQVTGTVDTSAVGSYTLNYSVSDGANPPATATRTVNVVDTTPPVITLTGEPMLILECGGTYEEPGATANDADGNSIVITGQPTNPLAAGDYLVRYNVSDAAGNPADEKLRFVVVKDTTAPVISLINEASMIINAGSVFVDPGATASDSCSGDLTDRIVTENEVNPNTPGVYTVTYHVVDFFGNTASATRTVNVQATSSVQWAANFAGPGYRVLVQFSQPVQSAGATLLSSYRTVTTAAQPTAVTLSADGLTATLTFSPAGGMASSERLQVGVGGKILNLLGNVLPATTRPIAANPADTQNPAWGVITKVNATKTVTMTFSEVVDKTSAENLANYLNATNPTTNPPLTAVLNADGRTVVLTFGSGPVNDEIHMSVGGSVKDINGNPLPEMDF